MTHFRVRVHRIQREVRSTPGYVYYSPGRPHAHCRFVRNVWKPCACWLRCCRPASSCSRPSAPRSIDMWPFLAGDAESPRLEVPLKGVSYDDGKRHQHVLIQTINGSVYKILIGSALSGEGVAETAFELYNLSAAPSERVNLVKGLAVAALDAAPTPAPTEARCQPFCYNNLVTPWPTKCG